MARKTKKEKRNFYFIDQKLAAHFPNMDAHTRQYELIEAMHEICEEGYSQQALTKGFMAAVGAAVPAYLIPWERWASYYQGFKDFMLDRYYPGIQAMRSSKDEYAWFFSHVLPHNPAHVDTVISIGTPIGVGLVAGFFVSAVSYLIISYNVKDALDSALETQFNDLGDFDPLAPDLKRNGSDIYNRAVQNIKMRAEVKKEFG